MLCFKLLRKECASNLKLTKKEISLTVLLVQDKEINGLPLHIIKPFIDFFNNKSGPSNYPRIRHLRNTKEKLHLFGVLYRIYL